MCATDGAFTQWLSQAQIAEDRLTAEQRGLLQYALPSGNVASKDIASRCTT